jgi:hypothetical protein
MRGRILLPLAVVTAVCVVGLGGFGIAAMAGHQPTQRTGAAGPAAPEESIRKTWEDASRIPAQAGAAQCTGCGVVGSIEPLSRETPGDAADASPGNGNGGNPVQTPAATAGPGHVVRLRMDDGSVRVVHEHLPPPWRVGQRVRLITGLLIALD